MNTAHELILLGGALRIASASRQGVIGSRFNAPLLLVFLLLGMLAGEDGLGRIQFSDFGAAYLIGSIALAIILFEGGLKTERRMIRLALWPSLRPSDDRRRADGRRCSRRCLAPCHSIH